jgi:hypothetical protein
MSNSSLDSRAKELEKHLAPKLGCYVKVGWMKGSDNSITFMVYIDQRASINYNVLPNDWYGDQIQVQLILPPGVKPPDPIPWPVW